jgi:soluble lytic murein transglycosylase-like protein
MNSQLQLKKRRLLIRQWVIFLLVMGLSQIYQHQTNNLWASEISFGQFTEPCSLLTSDALCDAEHMFYNSVTESFLNTIDNHLKPQKTSPKFAVKNEEILYASIVSKIANKHKIDPAIIMAIIMAESGYNPRAVSKKGAKGLMQLMPRTAKSLGVKNIFNPNDNINAGVRYFKKNLNRFNGDVKLALAAYNAGSGNVRKYRGIPPFRATKIYVKKVLEYYQLYKNHTFEAEG